MKKQRVLDKAEKILQKYELKNDHPIRKSINYKQIFDHIEGKDDFKTFKNKALYATRQLAKRQTTWFRGKMESWTLIDPNKLTPFIKKLNKSSLKLDQLI